MCLHVRHFSKFELTILKTLWSEAFLFASETQGKIDPQLDFAWTAQAPAIVKFLGSLPRRFSLAENQQVTD